MKHIIIIVAALSAAFAQAYAQNDTTFVVNDKKIVVGEKDGQTVVSVYGSDGYKQVKTREMEFVDGREVEHVYVGSPFIPVENLQNVSFRPHMPTVWWGFQTQGRGMFTSSTNGLYARPVGSFELGATPLAFALPFNSAHTIGLVFGVQLAWVHQCFDKKQVLGIQDGRVGFTGLSSKAKGNNINYGALRIPVMLSLQSDYRDYCMSLGISAEVRTNASYRFSHADAAITGMAPDAVKLRRFGLNLEYVLGMSPLTITATAGLTPIYKTTAGKNAYSAALKFGIDIPDFCRMLSKK